MLVVCLNLRSPGWARQCPAHARLWLPAEAWRVRQQKHSAATRASLFPGSGTLKLLLIRSSRTQIQFHSFITKSKPLSPFQAQSSGKRPSWHLCSALMRVTLPRACPGGNSCHEPSSTQVLLPFCSCFFQTFPQPHLQLLMHAGSGLFLQAAQTTCPNSNHIDVPCLSTSFTWHEAGLCSSTRPRSSSFTQYFLLGLLINT